MEPLLQECETAVNRLLSLDPEALDELRQHRGRRLAVFLTGTSYQFHITITETGIDLKSTAEADPDVTVRGTPAEFMRFLRFAQGEGQGASGTIELSGNVNLAQELQGVIKRLQPDWEEYLSQWLGDSLSHKLGDLARRSSRFLSGAGETLRNDINEYLIHEKDLLPDAREVDEFNAAVDTLRDDVERLRVRIERLRRIGKA